MKEGVPTAYSTLAKCTLVEEELFAIDHDHKLFFA